MLKRLGAEFLGTFWLVLGGCGSAVLAANFGGEGNPLGIGLAYEDIAPADMQAFLKKHPVVYPVAIVDVYDPPKDFATPRGLPMTYLLAPDGKVVKQFLGPVTAREIEAAIAGAGGPKAS